MKYLKTDIYPTEKTREWLLENTRTEIIDGKPVHYCARWMNLRLYFQTDNIRIYWNSKTVILQIKDNDPEEMKRSEFKEKYLKPAVLFFEDNFTRIHRHKGDA